MKEELLKQPEVRDEQHDEQTEQSSAIVSFGRVEALIKLRREKLETIKSFISLKVYNFINDKIGSEEQRLKDAIAQKKSELAKQNQTQTLPKAFFEQAHLKIKNIRID